VYDNANVLNVFQVQNEARNLRVPTSIYTINTFAGTSGDFDRSAHSHVASHPDLLVIAIDTVHHHLAIAGGTNVHLASSQYQNALMAFRNNFNNGDYTGATLACLRSLERALERTGLHSAAESMRS